VTGPVWVSGEALIDLLPGPNGDTLQVVAGGGPANTALALAKLGADVKFVHGISKDRFGQQIVEQFLAAGVDLELAVWSELPTALAIVSLDDQRVATYHFHLRETATFDFDPSSLPGPEIEQPSVLYVGSLSTLIEPGASHLFEWAKQVAVIAQVVFDPNVRPSVLSNRTEYLVAVQRWLEIANVVKVSEDDLSFLYPKSDLITSARSWLSPSRPLIVVTRGENGLMGVTQDEVAEVPAVRVPIVDTVGAGDTVGAVIVEALTKFGVNDLHGRLLQMTLTRAARAAAITCSRAGCQPPSAAELD